jgi:organic hydroperoxide reductase OsmC/OhrA
MMPDPSVERTSAPTSEAPSNRVKISATVRSASSRHEVVVSTDGSEQSLAVAPKASGQGSNVNGGEFLMLALATCYCNDLYREAARLGIPVESVEVEASAEFPGIGLAATGIAYRARVSSRAAPAEIAELLRVTDAVAEIHNTVRAGVPVTLEQ